MSLFIPRPHEIVEEVEDIHQGRKHYWHYQFMKQKHITDNSHKILEEVLDIPSWISGQDWAENNQEGNTFYLLKEAFMF